MYINDGSGAFGTRVTYATGSNPRYVKIADFDKDGNNDVVVTNYFSNNIGVMLGNGDGTLNALVTYSTSAR